jgi:hypothetical protein
LLSGVLSERLAASKDGAKARDAPTMRWSRLGEAEAAAATRHKALVWPIVRQAACPQTRKHTRQIQTRNANRLIRRGRTAGNRA